MRSIFFYLTMILLAISCTQESPDPTASFFKIYDDRDADVRYRPISVAPLGNSYIILAGRELDGSSFMGVQVIQISAEGDYIDQRILTDYVLPIPGLYQRDDVLYFFAMNPTTLQAVLLGVDELMNITQQSTVGGGVLYPVASNSLADGNLLLLSYDPIDQAMQLSRVGLNGNYLGGTEYSIGPGSDVLQQIINHYLSAGSRPLPFFCGAQTANTYYYNGFYNYSFSLVFTTLGDNPTGVVQGQSVNAGIRALLPLNGNNFALAGFQFDQNFIRPTLALTSTGITSSVNFFTANMAGIKPYSPVKIFTYTLNGAALNVFATESESRRIILYFFDGTSGNLRAVHQIGNLNPFTIGDVVVTDDNGLLILGTTFIAGRYERIVLNKLSEQEVTAFVK